MGGLNPAYSLPGGLDRSALEASHPSVASGKQSNRGIYGLMSIRGVPSRTSIPPTSRIFPDRSRSMTTVRPIPLGRQGCREAKIPWGSSSRKVGLTSPVEMVEEDNMGKGFNIFQAIRVLRKNLHPSEAAR